MEENIISTAGLEYGSDTIRTLDWKEHIRRRPGMYIGKLGDGTHADDGIYVLLKEVLDNAIDEYMMGYGKQIVIDIDEVSVTVRDHGRGIPLDKVKDVSSKMNTGAKYDSKAFKKSVGLNGVGIKAVNALSTEFYICSYRDGRCKSLLYNQGNVVTDFPEEPTSEENGTLVRFVPDYNKNFDYSDIRNGIVAAVSIKVEEPVFESQTKTKLGSRDIGPEGPSVSKFIGDFLKKELDNYLHKNAETADALLKKILESEKERKAIAGVTKLARERAKKSNLHNKKLRDCRVHYNDTKGDNVDQSSIFITEGDSATGSITKSRNVETQAVFSLRGKPLNSYGLTRKVVYENEEFNLLQAALNVEDGMDGLRYNKIIIATDADVDGMHIRLLLITFFLQFFPDLIKKGHVYILQTPLFRVRNKKETYYCYTEEERINAISKLGSSAEITRFKGLGEISPDEFRHFIGPDMRLDQVSLKKEDLVKDLLEFYMGKNTMERQNFIIQNLVTDEDLS